MDRELIKVSDRLPEESGDYLYWMTPTRYSGGFGVAWYGAGFNIWATGGADRITHWMPLPGVPAS